MMPILHSSGVMMPGQFGPITRDLEYFSSFLMRAMSCTGTPSVTATITSMPASIASMIESMA